MRYVRYMRCVRYMRYMRYMKYMRGEVREKGEGREGGGTGGGRRERTGGGGGEVRERGEQGGREQVRGAGLRMFRSGTLPPTYPTHLQSSVLRSMTWMVDVRPDVRRQLSVPPPPTHTPAVQGVPVLDMAVGDTLPVVGGEGIHSGTTLGTGERIHILEHIAHRWG